MKEIIRKKRVKPPSCWKARGIINTILTCEAPQKMSKENSLCTRTLRIVKYRREIIRENSSLSKRE